MSRCCENCNFSSHFGNTLDLEELIAGDYTEGIMCEKSGADTTPLDVCKEHKYIEGSEEYKNYILYDDQYLGPGYFIISELDNEIIKFMKLYISSKNSFPHYHAIAFEKDSIDQEWQPYRKIKFEFESDDALFQIINDLNKSLNDSQIKSIDPYNQGKNKLYTSSDERTASLVFEKDVLGVKFATDFININIGDNFACNQYFEFDKFFHSLSIKCNEAINEINIQKILKLTAKK